MRSFPSRQPDLRLFGKGNALIFASKPRNERIHFLYWKFEKQGTVHMRSLPLRRSDLRLFGKENALIFASKPRNERIYFLH